MGRRKKEIKQQKPENIENIYNEIYNDAHIVGDHNLAIKQEQEQEQQEQRPKKKKIQEDTLHKINMIEQIVKACPSIKEKTSDIIKKVLAPNKEKPQPQEYVLQQIKLEDKLYYRDNDGNIVDEKLNFVGMYSQKNKVYTYSLF